jgi:hypothetical protein
VCNGKIVPESRISEKHLFSGTMTLIGRENYRGIKQLKVVHSTNEQASTLITALEKNIWT